MIRSSILFACSLMLSFLLRCIPVPLALMIFPLHKGHRTASGQKADLGIKDPVTWTGSQQQQQCTFALLFSASSSDNKISQMPLLTILRLLRDHIVTISFMPPANIECHKRILLGGLTCAPVEPRIQPPKGNLSLQRASYQWRMSGKSSI